MTTSSSDPAGVEKPDDEAQQAGEPEATSEPGAIGDEQLPEDLQPTDDNPLAQSPEQEAAKDETAGSS